MGKKFFYLLGFMLSGSAMGVEVHLSDEVRDKIQSLRRLKTHVEVALSNLQDNSRGMHQVVDEIFGGTRSLLWDKKGLIEKLWSSTTFFKWEMVKEEKGNMGALENRKLRFNSQEFQQQVINYHRSIIDDLSNLIISLKRNQGLWMQVTKDRYRLLNITAFDQHQNLFLSSSSASQVTLGQRRETRLGTPFTPQLQESQDVMHSSMNGLRQKYAHYGVGSSRRK